MAMTTMASIAPAVPAGGPSKKPNPFAKKGGAGVKGKKGVNPFAKKGAAPGAKQIGSAKTGPIDPKTLGSMTASLKGG